MHPTGIPVVIIVIALVSQVAAFAAPANIPTIDVQNTCKIAARAMVQLMGGSTAGNDVDICLSSEQRAREQLVTDWGTYSSEDKNRCVRTGVYLPSYVEWLTCLEMERDVRKMKVDQPDPKGPVTLPKVIPGTLW